MADHTPGPWTVEVPMGAEIGLSIVQAGLKTYEWEFIALVGQSDASDERMGRQRFISSEEQAANACLIAAAPDLLAALKSFMSNNSIVHGLPLAARAARAAIAKAEGRTPSVSSGTSPIRQRGESE